MLIFGMMVRPAAMVADGIHSLTDLASDIGNHGWDQIPVLQERRARVLWTVPVYKWYGDRQLTLA